MTKKFPTIILLTLLVLLSACKNEVAPPAPHGAIPSPQQLAWQKLETYMFIHFGPNTFTDAEWGHGKEDPNIFNPTALDCNQWAATAKAAGMKAIIITAKHHDGFCLWPSMFSKHTVRESLWKGGKGDVLRELSEACKKYGLQFGVYLSPWDQNHPMYGDPVYNDQFAGSLNEVLSNYGPVFEQWFDGANGSTIKQKYDWPLFHETVFKNQPQAIIFSDIGPGCRWMGNERGVAGTTNWSTLNIEGFSPGLGAPPTDTLNSGNKNGKQWVPAEVDVSIRPGWFYSQSTDSKVKSLAQLMDIYYTSVGRNANLLLNVPPDRRGLIHQNDSIALMEMRKMIDLTFKDNLAEKAKVKASNTRGGSKLYQAANIINNDYDSYWATDDGQLSADIEIDLGSIQDFNRIVLQEYIPLGQRISSFTIEYWNNGTWQLLDTQTTIGYKRILCFPNIQTQKIRLQIKNALAAPCINHFAVFNAPEIVEAPQIKRSKDGMLTIKGQPDVKIYYTIDGSDPTLQSPQFTEAFDFKNGGIIKAKTITDKGTSSALVEQKLDLAPSKWSVVQGNSLAQAAIDGDFESVYTNVLLTKADNSLQINLGEVLDLKGFWYMPAPKEHVVMQQKGHALINVFAGCNILRYTFAISENGKQWTNVLNNVSFANMQNNPILQEVKFDQTYKAKYIKITCLESVCWKAGKQHLSIGEIGVLTR